MLEFSFATVDAPFDHPIEVQNCKRGGVGGVFFYYLILKGWVGSSVSVCVVVGCFCSASAGSE
ncbi:hypothetical protein N431DRAFT_55329 [Stipitochalara longipes BDJ]|nr:hypothetical protein N431DRAFT_55329 [Stipitochalara longipes BDJ]